MSIDCCSQWKQEKHQLMNKLSWHCIMGKRSVSKENLKCDLSFSLSTESSWSANSFTDGQWPSYCCNSFSVRRERAGGERWAVWKVHSREAVFCILIAGSRPLASRDDMSSTFFNAALCSIAYSCSCPTIAVLQQSYLKQKSLSFVFLKNPCLAESAVVTKPGW